MVHDTTGTIAQGCRFTYFAILDGPRPLDQLELGVGAFEATDSSVGWVLAPTPGAAASINVRAR